jgi:RES domain-containing protein
VTFKLIARGGRYLRVADPDWADPLDGSYAQAKGQRWSPPGSFAVVYLNADRGTARLNVERMLADQPFGPEDVDPDEAFILVAADVPADEYVDVVTDEGCEAAGLPATYPLDAHGVTVTHGVCQPIGRDAYDQNLPGIACRTAAEGATGGEEELAYFIRAAPLVEKERWHFDDWFWAE